MNLTTEIKNFIVTEFVPGGSIDEIDDEMDLIANGVIDSLGVLNLISMLEQDMGLAIAAEDMDTANFSTVARIVRFVETQGAVAA